MENLYRGAGIIVPKPLRIPNITNGKLVELYSTIKPIVEIDSSKYFLREFTLQQLKRQSYIWNRNEDKREKIELERLKALRDFICLHTGGTEGLFEPTIAEVLSQFPIELVGEANAFEMVEKPETVVDIFRYKEAIDSGFHLSKVRAYKVSPKC